MDDLFTLFPNLPKELQLEIWEHAIPDARVIELEPECFHSKWERHRYRGRKDLRQSQKAFYCDPLCLFGLKHDGTKDIPHQLLAIISMSGVPRPEKRLGHDLGPKYPIGPNVLKWR
jgi:hypothetical protein